MVARIRFGNGHRGAVGLHVCSNADEWERGLARMEAQGDLPDGIVLVSMVAPPPGAAEVAIWRGTADLDVAVPELGEYLFSVSNRHVHSLLVGLSGELCCCRLRLRCCLTLLALLCPLAVGRHAVMNRTAL